MSDSLVNSCPPQGHFAPCVSRSASGMYQASAPDRANSSTTLLFTRGSFKDFLHELHPNTAMGTPHTRCREMHQSGRVSTMLEIRSSPHVGSHLTALISSRARVRKVISAVGAPSKLCLDGDFVSIDINHCSVARKITGLWQRQQCGYWCSTFSECSRAPRVFSSSMIGSFALRTFKP